MAKYGAIIHGRDVNLSGVVHMPLSKQLSNLHIISGMDSRVRPGKEKLGGRASRRHPAEYVYSNEKKGTFVLSIFCSVCDHLKSQKRLLIFS